MVYSEYFPCAALFLRSNQAVTFFCSKTPYAPALTKSAFKRFAFFGTKSPFFSNVVSTECLLHNCLKCSSKVEPIITAAGSLYLKSKKCLLISKKSANISDVTNSFIESSQSFSISAFMEERIFKPLFVSDNPSPFTRSSKSL